MKLKLCSKNIESHRKSLLQAINEEEWVECGEGESTMRRKGQKIGMNQK